MRRLAPALVLALACAGGGEAPVYLHNRQDYAALRERFPGLREPNYLPFMAARVAAPGARGEAGLRRLGALLRPGRESGELLVFCRWPDAAFPLRVHVEPPRIADRFDEGLFPRPVSEYVEAVDRALALWEEAIDDRQLFTRVEEAEGADLVVRLRGEEAPTPDPTLQVLGATPLGKACRVEAGSADDERLTVRYAVGEVRVFVADQHGLLLPDQVERIALHELGHALGMHGHSPIPNDLMFRVVRDRLPRGELGAEDVNSFLSLYAIPNGTVYVALPSEAPGGVEPAPAPVGAPRLGLAPHVDARLGYEVQLPDGWTRVAMQQGVVAVDGVTWDYTSSFQILVRSYPSLDAYLERYAGAHLGRGRLVEQSELQVAGRPALRFLLESPDGRVVEELTFVEGGDGRVVVAIGESPAEQRAAFQPFFRAILDSLELHERGPGATDRDYSPSPP